MASKEQFLNKIAGKLGRGRIQTVDRPHWTNHPADHLYRGAEQHELVDMFAQELGKLGGEVIRIGSAADVGGALKRLLEERQFKKLIAWPAPDKYNGAEPAAVLSADEGYEVVYWQENGPREELIRIAEQSQAGLVYAEHGLAETGSVILYNRGSHGRLVSLLPNQVIVVLRASTVLPRLTQLLPKIGGNVAEHSVINVITGPSRTSDIEMDLTIGVHGPGRIAILLIEDLPV